MKLLSIFAILLSIYALPLRAQESTPLTTGSSNATNSSNTPNAILPPLHSIPAPTPASNAREPEPKPITAPREQPTPAPISPEENLQKSKTGKAELAISRLVKFRETQIRAERNPRVAAALERSQSAKTYAEENAARREYYTLLYNLMQRQSPDLKDLIDAQRKIALDNKVPQAKKHHSHAAKHPQGL